MMRPMICLAADATLLALRRLPIHDRQDHRADS